MEHKKNLKRHEFDRELLAFANDPGHRESDMMILAILSHGREGNVFASDGTVIAIESIYEKFNNKNCPALQGKPKFFIIQVGGLKPILKESGEKNKNLLHSRPAEGTTQIRLTSTTIVKNWLRRRRRPARSGGTARTRTGPRSATLAR